MKPSNLPRQKEVFEETSLGGELQVAPLGPPSLELPLRSESVTCPEEHRWVSHPAMTQSIPQEVNSQPGSPKLYKILVAGKRQQKKRQGSRRQAFVTSTGSPAFNRQIQTGDVHSDCHEVLVPASASASTSEYLHHRDMGPWVGAAREPLLFADSDQEPHLAGCSVRPNIHCQEQELSGTGLMPCLTPLVDFREQEQVLGGPTTSPSPYGPYQDQGSTITEPIRRLSLYGPYQDQGSTITEPIYRLDRYRPYEDQDPSMSGLPPSLSPVSPNQNQDPAVAGHPNSLSLVNPYQDQETSKSLDSSTTSLVTATGAPRLRKPKTSLKILTQEEKKLHIRELNNEASRAYRGRVRSMKGNSQEELTRLELEHTKLTKRVQELEVVLENYRKMSTLIRDLHGESYFTEPRETTGEETFVLKEDQLYCPDWK